MTDIIEKVKLLEIDPDKKYIIHVRISDGLSADDMNRIKSSFMKLQKNLEIEDNCEFVITDCNVKIGSIIDGSQEEVSSSEKRSID